MPGIRRSSLVVAISELSAPVIAHIFVGFDAGLAAFLRTLVFELASVFILPALFGIDAIWFSVVIAEILDIFVTFGLLIHYNKEYLAD